MDQNNTQDPAVVVIGGEQRPRVILPIINEDGTPRYYRGRIKGYKRKEGRPNIDEATGIATPSFFYSWTFEVLDSDSKEAEFPVVFGQTNDQARRHYITKKPLKLLQLIVAANQGKEPAKDTKFSLDDLNGRTVRISLEEKKGNDGEIYQVVKEYYPDGKAKIVPPVEAAPTVDIDGVDQDGAIEL